MPTTQQRARFARSLGMPRFSGGETIVEPYAAGSARVASCVWVGDTLRLVLRNDNVTNQTRWGYFALNGMSGRRPTIDWQAWGVAAGSGWGHEKVIPRWSYDGVTWTAFDNLSSSSTTTVVSNNAPFARDIVLVSMQAPHAFPEFMDYLRTQVLRHAWVSNTASTTNFVYATQAAYGSLDINQGVLRASQPLLAFRITKAGATPTKLITIINGVHAAGEAGSKQVLIGMLDWFLNSTDEEATALRNAFTILVYAHTNPAGEICGMGRASGDDATTDCNRILHEATPSRPHAAAFKAAIIADVAAVGLGSPAWSIDLHQDMTYATHSVPSYLLADVSGGSTSPNQRYYNRAVARSASLALNPYAGGGSGTGRWLATSVLTSGVSITCETGPWQMPTVLRALGADLLRAVADGYAAGEI
jgi:hypothetical protein